MCGIIGYAGNQPAAPILLDALSRLEYRGYDSAGIGVIGPTGELNIQKAKGKLSGLKMLIGQNLPDGKIGVGHTRWATHGPPTDLNAHPHTDCSSDLIVVHNGIVENYLELKDKLQGQGHTFVSQTDSECIPHVIESYLNEGHTLEEAVRLSASDIRGPSAVMVASKNKPNKLIAFRLGNAGGIVIGYAENEMYLASDLPALVPLTRKVVYLLDGELVIVYRNGAEYIRSDGSSIEKIPTDLTYDVLAGAKGKYEHFMLKEINDQPEVVINTMRGRVDFETSQVNLPEFPFSDKEIMDIEKIVLVGMGTSLHAAMVGRYWFERFARIPSETDNSSEFRYRDPVIDNRTLVISVCQSGETADTLAAMEEASIKGAKQFTLCNYPGTQTTRISDGTMMIMAGPEIGVASSKTFVCSLLSLYLLAIYIGEKRGNLGHQTRSDLVTELTQLPKMLGNLIANEKQYKNLAIKYHGYNDFLFLGRGLEFPLAMEGALKLKEISYIHAEGYSAGEMKHGPISLIEDKMPVVALTPKNQLYTKMISNVNEAKARGAQIIAVASQGDEAIQGEVDDVILLPKTSSTLTPILMAVPMQLMAYHIAVRRGCEVDQPRNLAKSVTVE